AQTLLLCSMLGCATPISHPTIAWDINIQLDDHDQPSGKIWLAVGGERHLITDDPIGGYGVLSRAEYEQHQIPSDAILARSSWWAGVGEDMYVRVEQDCILVFRREFGET